MLPAAWIINTIKNIIEGDRKYRALYAHLPCNSQQKDLKKSACLDRENRSVRLRLNRGVGTPPVHLKSKSNKRLKLNINFFWNSSKPDNRIFLSNEGPTHVKVSSGAPAKARAPASTVLWEDLPRQVGSKMNVFHSQHHYTPSLTASEIYVP